MDGIQVAVLIFAVGVGVFIGSLVTNTAWQQDCARLGSHLSDGKVYECKVRS